MEKNISTDPSHQISFKTHSHKIWKLESRSNFHHTLLTQNKTTKQTDKQTRTNSNNNALSAVPLLPSLPNCISLHTYSAEKKMRKSDVEALCIAIFPFLLKDILWTSFTNAVFYGDARHSWKGKRTMCCEASLQQPIAHKFHIWKLSKYGLHHDMGNPEDSLQGLSRNDSNINTQMVNASIISIIPANVKHGHNNSHQHSNMM